MAFLKGRCGIVTCDNYNAYNVVLRAKGRAEAECSAHARRKFDELAKRTDLSALCRVLGDHAQAQRKTAKTGWSTPIAPIASVGRIEGLAAAGLSARGGQWVGWVYRGNG